MLTAVRAKRVLTMADQRPSPCGSVSRAPIPSPVASPIPSPVPSPGAAPASPVSPVASPVSSPASHGPASHGPAPHGPTRYGQTHHSPAPLPPVLDDAVVVAHHGIITDVLPYADFRAAYSFSPHDLGPVTILPGLVNCHTHLELSHLAGRATCGKGFEAWIDSLLPLMAPDAVPAEDRLHALEQAAASMVRTGTVLAADVTSAAPHHVHEAAQRHGLHVEHQLEVFGYAFSPRPDMQNIWPAAASSLPGQVRKRNTVLAGHALYSTHPAALVLAKQWCRSRERHFSMHLAEHPGEEQMLQNGTGTLRTMLARRVLPADFAAPGMRPVAYAAELGLLDERTLAVHCVHCNKADIALLRASGATVCLCPRSNALIGVGRPPVQSFMEAGIPLCIGTDSLASNHDLDLWNEARVLRDEYHIPVPALLRMLTAEGARILGHSHTLGSLEPGKLFRYAVLPNDFS